MENTKENSKDKGDKSKIKKLPVWHEQQELILKIGPKLEVRAVFT